jgi:hypothetical protein
MTEVSEAFAAREDQNNDGGSRHFPISDAISGGDWAKLP